VAEGEVVTEIETLIANMERTMLRTIGPDKTLTGYVISIDQWRILRATLRELASTRSRRERD
jgi:hypothetical protein